MGIPSARTSVVATVLNTSVRFDKRTGNAVRKMRIRVDSLEGTWEAWGSVPRDIDDGFSLEGQKITLTATFEPQGEGFAFFKRPRAELLGVTP